MVYVYVFETYYVDLKPKKGKNDKCGHFKSLLVEPHVSIALFSQKAQTRGVVLADLATCIL